MRLFRQRSSRALLATLAVSALAIVGLDDPTRLPAPVRAELEPTPTPAFSIPVKRPNVLMVTVDDLAVADMPYLPRVRRLMQKGGVTFADALAPTPICVPARASLLTGQYAHNHGALNISGPDGGYAAFDGPGHDRDRAPGRRLRHALHREVPERIRQERHELDMPPGWTDWRATIDPSSYRFFRPRMNINSRLVRSKGYTTDVMTRQARRMIGNERDGRPWFAWVNYVAPHVGGPVGEGDPKRVYAGTRAGRLKTTVPAREDRGRYRKVPLPLAPSSFPDGDASVPDPSAREQQALRRPGEDRADDGLPAPHRGGARPGSGGGLALPLPAREGQLDRTLVIFTSDNGFAIGPHNLNGKLYHYDESVRIPVYMRGPGLPRGVSVPTAVTNPDLAATILAAAGVDSPRPLDGVDILPWIGAPAQVRVVPIEAWGLPHQAADLPGRPRRGVDVRRVPTMAARSSTTAPGTPTRSTTSPTTRRTPTSVQRSPRSRSATATAAATPVRTRCTPPPGWPTWWGRAMDETVLERVPPRPPPS